MSVLKNLGRVISVRSVPCRSTAGLTGFQNVSFTSVSVMEAEKKQPGGDKQSLYRKLSGLGMKKGMVSTTIDDYINGGKTITKRELDRYAKELRKYGKPHLSLEIMDWMETRGINKAYRDFPVYLDLVAKVKGIEEAGLYFKGLSDVGRNQFTYGALLNCYCMEMMEDKALALFKEMEEKNLAFTSVAFGNVMSLYMKLGQSEKVAPLVKDMKKRNMEISTFIYCLWMTSCSSLGDVEGAEKVFFEAMQASPKRCDWTIYSNLAATYVKAGHKEKAELALKKVEEMGSQDRKAYHLLITLHAGISNLSEVHRLWKFFKRKFEAVNNMSYLIMLQALGKLDDLVGLKDCYEEWESRQGHAYDLRLPLAVIRVYLKKHMVEEAQALFRSAKKRSSKYPFLIVQAFMTYYLENNQGQQALDCMKEAGSQVKDNEWHIRDDVIKEFIRYCEKVEDADFGLEFCQLLMKVNSLQYATYKSLLGTYIV